MKHKFKFQKWKAGILILLVIAICTGGYFGLSAFFTDHSVLAEQIKTGKWNYQLSVDATGDPVDGVTAGSWNAKEGVTLFNQMEADTTVAVPAPISPACRTYRCRRSWRTAEHKCILHGS